MNKLVSHHIQEHCDEHLRFVYSKTLDYIHQLSLSTGSIDVPFGKTNPMDIFLEYFYPMISIVTPFVLFDVNPSLDID